MRSTFSEQTRQAISAQLQPLVVELADLSLTGKQLHWTVTGPNFRALHLQLDEFVDSYRTWTDQVAERLSAVGVPPDGRAGTVARETPHQPVPDGWLKDQDVVSMLSDRIEATIKRVREAMEEVEKVDLATQDVLIRIASGLEEQLWMLSVQEA
ncbi:MAG TPA: DNA starvation/stationary phase protection protein [Acidimicrobiia bacterium]|nr:DNA starvation/stationary phase protection protein [Acidimicrobiia bacterium]